MEKYISSPPSSIDHVRNRNHSLNNHNKAAMTYKDYVVLLISLKSMQGTYKFSGINIQNTEPMILIILY